MGKTTTSYGLTVDFSRCAWDLRDRMHDRGVQTILLTNLVCEAGLCGPGTYFSDCYKLAKTLGRKLTRFMDDLLAAVNDDVLCMGHWVSQGGTAVHALFSYESTEEPSEELLVNLAQCLGEIARGASSVLTLEGLAESSEVSPALRQLSQHLGEDWGRVAQALSATGGVVVEVAPAGSTVGHVVRRVDERVGKSSPASSGTSQARSAVPVRDALLEPGVAIEDVMVPGYPPHALVNKGSGTSRRQVAALKASVRIEDWPRRCDELRLLTGHDGPDDEAWLAIVAKQVAESRLVSPTDSLPGYVELPLLFDRGGRPLYAILRASSDPLDVRPSLTSIMDHENAAANVPLGVSPGPDRTFHALDYLSYLGSRAARSAHLLDERAFAELAARVGEGRAPERGTLEALSRYAQAWDEMNRALEYLGQPGVTTLRQVEALAQEWSARALRRVDRREALREVIEECSERFRAVVPWGHPVINADLEGLDGPEGPSDQDLKGLEDAYVALVEEMGRDEPYEERGLDLERAEQHFGPLGAMFDMLRSSFVADPVSLDRLRRADAPSPALAAADATADAGSQVEDGNGEDLGVPGPLPDEVCAEGAVALVPAAADEGLLIDEVPSFHQGDEGPRELAQDELRQLEALAAPTGPTAEHVEDSAEPAEPEGADLRSLCSEDYRAGRESGVPCDFSTLFELGSGRVWPRAEVPEGTDAFARCALMGERSLPDVLACAEEALRDGVRPTRVHRILDPVRSLVPDSPGDPSYQRFWSLAALADRLGLAAGAVQVDQLVEDLEYLTLGEETLPLGPGLACLLAEAALTALTHRLSGRTVGTFQALLALFDEKDVQRAALQTIPDDLAALLGRLEESYAYNPAIDYSAMTLPALESVRVRGGLESLAEEAALARDTPPSTNYLPAKKFWSVMATREDPESHLGVGVLLADMTGGGARARVDREELHDLRVDVDDSLDADHRNLFWTAQGHGAYERIVGQARQALISTVRKVYDLYERYLDLLDAGAAAASPGVSGAVAAGLDVVHRGVLSSLRGLNAERRGAWGTLVERVVALQEDYPSGRLEAGGEAPAGLADAALPPDLRTESGRALVELLLHSPALRGDGRFEVPGPVQLEECVGQSRELLERSFTFNVVDERLYALLRATLARTLGVVDASGGASGGERATGAVLARWTLALVDVRLDALSRALVSRAAALLEGGASLDEGARALLGDAVASGDVARVFAYADYEVDNALISLAAPPKSYEDEFYGGQDGALGLVDPICRALSGAGRPFSYRNLAFDPDLTNQYGADRAEAAFSSFRELRRAIGGLKSCVREHRLPVDGLSVRTAGEGTSPATTQALDRVSRYLREIFGELGFEDAEVTPSVSHADVAAPVSSWRLRFYASPSDTDSRGELVCPLREFVTLSDPADGLGPARVEYEVEIFRKYDELEKALLRETPPGDVRRIALYLALSESDMLTPQMRRDLMPARTTPRDLRAAGMMVLDEVLVAYLASVPRTKRSNDRLSAFFRCTLPFTAPQPYGDDIRRSAGSQGWGGPGAGQPPLFYGRGTILQQLRTRAGTTFIYGARRMGKTSILREFAAEERAKLHDPKGSEGKLACVAYVDAMGFAGVDLDNFWTQFVGRAFERDVAGIREARSASEVRDALTAASREKSFYLLIDEADDLLRYDSFLRVGHPRNAIMDSLVEYMQQNEKFRVILGGLHATMRYADERARPNQTRGQLGHAVVVGPLWEGGAYEDAVRLVREPLKMMGYVLRDEDVLKILSKACYFPNLINIVCEHLLVVLRQQRRPTSTGTFVLVPGATVDSVLREVTGALAEKFRLTIELDPGYDVAVSALMSLEADSAAEGSPRRAFTADELLRQVSDACAGGDGQGAPAARDLADSGLLDSLGSDIDELVRFGILKKVDDLVMLRDGSMRALVGQRWERDSARMVLQGACRRYLDRDVLDGRLEEGEARNIVSVKDVALFSPVNARDAAAVGVALREHGHCVVVAGEIAGSRLLTEHPGELLPTLCGGSRPVLADGAGLRGMLGAGLPDELVVVPGGWGAEELRAFRGAGRTSPSSLGVLLVASPRTAWELRDELALADDVVVPTPWSDWTCLAWVRGFTERYERTTTGTIESRAQRALAARLRGLCGAQAGAVAQVVENVPSDGSSFSLRQEMEAFSGRALDEGDFAWVLDGSCEGADVIARVWGQLAGFADADAEHPLDVAYTVRDWLDFMDADAGLSRADLEAVLSWMAEAGLARRVGAGDEGAFEMRDWFMHALLARAGGVEGERGES